MNCLIPVGGGGSVATGVTDTVYSSILENLVIESFQNTIQYYKPYIIILYYTTAYMLSGNEWDIDSVLTL